MTLDFTNFREFTDGDSELEMALFKEFINSSSALLRALQDEFDGDLAQWQKTAHAFKGISLNLGAATLGDLCYQAQEFKGDDSARRVLLDKISSEYDAVIHALKEEIVRIAPA